MSITKVLFGPNPSISRWIYTDIIDNDECEYCDFDRKAESKLRQILFARRILGIMPHCLKRMVLRKLLGYRFLKMNRDSELTFMFTCQYTMFFMTCFWTFVSFLKREFPKATFAFYYYDIIYTCCPELVDRVKQEFPHVLTFDPGDAEKYGLEYYGEICSSTLPEGDSTIKPFDIFYAGGDRGRFDTILEAFRIMTDQGRKCIFYVIDIDPSNIQKLCDFFQIQHFDPTTGATLRYRDSIMHCNIYCNYPKALNHIEKCKCLFEVVFPGQTSGSLRLPQACIYHKKLITNCQWVANREFYDPNIISIFETPSEIDTSFIDSPINTVDSDFSPLTMIDHVINQFNS